MKAKIIFTLGIFLFSFIAAGCGPAPTTTPVDMTLVPAGPSLPSCSATVLEAPAPVSPRGSLVIDSLTPALTWDYSAADCYPSKFSVEIFEQAAGFATATTTTVDGTATSLTLATPLKPGTAYVWRVRAVNGVNLSPLDGVSDDLGAGWVIFFTGPLCEDAALAAPALDAPADGATVMDTATLTLTWHYPGACLPNSYRPEIASDPAFTDIIASYPGTKPMTSGWSPLTDLKDCTKFYWRVGSLKSDGTSLLYSEARSFSVNLKGDCPLVPMSVPVPTRAYVPLPAWTDVPTETQPAPADTPRYDCSQYKDQNLCTTQGGNFCNWDSNQQNQNGGTCVNKP